MEYIECGYGSDSVSAGPDNDVLACMSNTYINASTSKKLVGGTGNDKLFGDALSGGSGSDDYCSGGSGSPDTADAGCEVKVGIP